ncbi:MAG TPA: lipoyl(octanoyl) transferase LipB [Solirubrobacteraceae bacterium]
MDELWTCELGTVAFDEALALQTRLCEARKADEVPDTLLLLDHHPVYTRGRRSSDADLPLGADFYAAQGIEVVEVDRGGLVTYHGPGQLVGYPIIRIGDVIGYLRTLEQAIVAALATEGVAARGGERRPTGVWVGERKIASIGVHVSRRVATHGFAVNVDNDLQPFEWIVPCGLDAVSMTSLARESGVGGSLERFRESVADQVALAFGRRRRAISPDRLSAALAAGVAG